MNINSEFQLPDPLNILLAEDDQDDCLFFKEALEELQLSVNLTIVHNGEELMQYLTEKQNELPHVLFLDLNMPRKNGFACLLKIKLDDNLKNLPVVILSTYFDQDMLNLVYKDAAHYYIRKPGDFAHLKTTIFQALTLIFKDDSLPGKKDFVLSGD